VREVAASLDREESNLRGPAPPCNLPHNSYRQPCGGIEYFCQITDYASPSDTGIRVSVDRDSAAVSDSVALPRATPPHLAVRASPRRQHGLVCLIDVPAGTCVTNFTGHALGRTPTWRSVQVDIDSHVELLPQALRYTNHCCRPNGFFDTHTQRLIAVEPISEGDEVTVFYPATEWRMVAPFSCRCEHDTCIGWVEGAAALPETVLRHYRLNPHIERLRAAVRGLEADDVARLADSRPR